MVSGHAEVAGFRAGLRGEEFCTVCEPHEIDDIKPLLTCKSRNFDLKVKERVMVGISSISALISSILAATGTQSVVWSQGSGLLPLRLYTSSLGKTIICLLVQAYRRLKAISFVPLDGGKENQASVVVSSVNAETWVPQTQNTLGCDRSIPQRTYRCDLKHGQVPVICPSDKS